MSTVILILEDEPFIADLIKERFTDEGYDVKVAYTGTDGVRQINEGKFDLVTMDIYLPDANGLDILRDMKQNPATHAIPVVIISSATEEERKAREIGAEAFMAKPINFARLFQIVEEIKKQHHSQ